MVRRIDNVIAEWPLADGSYLQARVIISTDFDSEYESTGNFGYFRYVIKRKAFGRKSKLLYRGFPGCWGCPRIDQIDNFAKAWGSRLKFGRHIAELTKFSRILHELAETPTWLYPKGRNARRSQMRENAQRVAHAIYRLLLMKGKFFHRVNRDTTRASSPRKLRGMGY